MNSLESRVAELEAAIREHRSQKADDRCIEDDDRLYAVLGDGITCDRRVGDKGAMLENCRRFIENRCQGGGWPTYRELEERLAAAHRRVNAAETLLSNQRVMIDQLTRERDEALAAR